MRGYQVGLAGQSFASNSIPRLGWQPMIGQSNHPANDTLNLIKHAEGVSLRSSLSFTLCCAMANVAATNEIPSMTPSRMSLRFPSFLLSFPRHIRVFATQDIKSSLVIDVRSFSRLPSGLPRSRAASQVNLTPPLLNSHQLSPLTSVY